MRRPIPKFDNDELVKSSFWVGQVFMIVATVLGVYLAAQQGLRQAIIFDDLSNKEDNYYLRKSLYDEVADNIATLEAYAERIVKENPYNVSSLHPTVGDFIWQNMQYSNHTLQTPSDILSAIRRFNIQYQAVIGKIETRKYGVTSGAKKLIELIEPIKTQTLPALKASYEKLAQELAEAEVDLE